MTHRVCYVSAMRLGMGEIFLFLCCSFQLASAAPLVIGHRGNPEAAPENTLASLRSAIATDVDLVEADIWLTKDGELVVVHDETVDRTTDSFGNIADFLLAEAKLLDAGSWMSQEFAGERIPTLEEMLVEARGRVPLHLDIKVDNVGAKIAAIMERHGLPAETVYLSAWTEDQLEDYRAHLTSQIVWCGEMPRTPSREYFDKMKKRGVTAFERGWWDYSALEHALIRDNGFRFWTYTINEEPLLLDAIQVGVDAIETDVPRALVHLLAGYSQER